MPLASLTDRTPVAPAEAAKDRSAPGKVTGKLKIAVDAMVWEGLSRDKAAEKARISEHSLYNALRKAHVRQHYLSELEVLRTSERAKNIHRLTEIRDAKDNMPAVQAIAMLERMSEESATRSGASIASPGLTVVIVNAPAQVVTDAPVTQRVSRIIENDEGST